MADNVESVDKKRSYDPYVAAAIIIWLLLRGGAASASEELPGIEELPSPGNVVVTDEAIINASSGYDKAKGYEEDYTSFFIEYPGLKIYTPVKEVNDDVDSYFETYSSESSSSTVVSGSTTFNSDVKIGTINLALPEQTASIKYAIDSKVFGRRYVFNNQLDNFSLTGELQNEGFPVSKVEVKKISDVFPNDRIYTNFSILIYADVDKIRLSGKTVAQQFFLIKKYIIENIGFSETTLKNILAHHLWVHYTVEAMSEVNEHNNNLQFLF